MPGRSVAEVEALRRRVEAHPFWWHRIDLGDGVVTPGPDDSPAKLRAVHLPADLTGKSVLDVGAWDGFFSFEAERRGARRVVAADHYAWVNPKVGDGGFEIARAALGSRVQKHVARVEELRPEAIGTFDVVLFLGVLYHAEDPLRYLRIVRSLCREMAIIETHTDGHEYDRPMMVFYPGDTLNGDGSNVWGPNRAAVERMLLEVGFRRVEYVAPYLDTRMVFHAWV